MMKRFLSLATACTLLLSCDTTPPPDQYVLITQLRTVAIEDADSSGGGMGGLGGGGGGAGELIVLGAILVVAGTMAVVDAFSDKDVHARKAFMYDVQLPDGKTINLLQDEKDSSTVVEPGQWAVLHYGKGNPDDKHCVKPVSPDAQGRLVLQAKACEFKKTEPAKAR